MNRREALRIVLDLARQNALPNDVGPELEHERRRQRRAIAIIEKLAAWWEIPR